uniref:IGLON5 protein n=1 Tax=Fopius arisanus TaxID=64838 RepID=A0A0C9RX72_9HYME
MDGQRLINIIYAFFFIGLLLKETEPIKITKVEIPSVVRAGTEEPIILDCQYNMGSSTNRALVVKWYINEDILYQWIYGRAPLGADEYQQYVDASYRASDDLDMEYRAVKLVRPSHELSGKVRCSISCQEDEDEAQGEMLVYSPEQLLRIAEPISNDETKQLSVTCLAESVYPLPIITIRQDNRTIKEQKEYHNKKKDGRYDIGVSAVIPMENMNLPTKFQCEIHIAAANYTSIREYVYNGE